MLRLLIPVSTMHIATLMLWRKLICGAIAMEITVIFLSNPQISSRDFDIVGAWDEEEILMNQRLLVTTMVMEHT